NSFRNIDGAQRRVDLLGLAVEPDTAPHLRARPDVDALEFGTTLITRKVDRRVRAEWRGDYKVGDEARAQILSGQCRLLEAYRHPRQRSFSQFRLLGLRDDLERV